MSELGENDTSLAISDLNPQTDKRSLHGPSGIFHVFFSSDGRLKRLQDSEIQVENELENTNHNEHSKVPFFEISKANHEKTSRHNTVSHLENRFAAN